VRTLKKLLLVSVPALVLTFAILEFVVLRFWVPIDDVPVEEYDGDNGIIHYRPRQTGVSFPDRDIRHPVPFTVNQDGWNSTHSHYDVARGGKLRVAIVGDSYVAAFEVPPRSSLAGQLEARLGEDQGEVYSFGIRGAPLSEYLQIARYVSGRYRPDVIVVLIVHNDFDESYRPSAGRYTAAFLRLAVDGDSVEEIPPQPYREPLAEEWVRTRSYAFRFLFYRLQVGGQRIRNLYAALHGGPRRFEANVDVGDLADEDARMRKTASYVFGQLARLEASSRARVLLVMDAPRDAVYDGRDPRKTEAYRMNRIAAEASAASGVQFIDLTTAFEEDYRDHHMRFEFAQDGHWNARGHAVAAEEVYQALQASNARRPSVRAEMNSPIRADRGR
jgi:lysophospholipase L1-like esterase